MRFRLMGKSTTSHKARWRGHWYHKCCKSDKMCPWCCRGHNIMDLLQREHREILAKIGIQHTELLLVYTVSHNYGNPWFLLYSFWINRHKVIKF